jgi:hypothetical protein
MIIKFFLNYIFIVYSLYIVNFSFFLFWSNLKML